MKHTADSNGKSPELLPAQPIRLLSLELDLPLRGPYVQAFRGAVAEAAGLEQELFHNHSADGTTQRRYPLVQYRVRQGRAAIFAINEGVPAVQNWYLKSAGKLRVGSTEVPLELRHLDVRESTLRMCDRPQWYYLSSYLPFNTDHYLQWLEAPSLLERVTLIQSCLTTHLLAFARAMHWRLPEHMQLDLQQLVQTKKVKYHGVPMVAFDVVFSANVALPAGVGLGRAVSHGFGISYPVKPFDRKLPVPEFFAVEESVG